MISLPNFLGIGAQRCGTTWIFECMREHPDIFLAKKKEIGYFTYNYSKGITWYGQWFKERKSERIIGEITPEYMLCKNVAKRIKDELGNIKILVCIRNPIERAYSSYGRSLREKEHNLSFQKYIENNFDFVLNRSFYYKQLVPFVKIFEENILILIYDDLINNSLEFIQNIYRFLDINQKFVPTQLKNKFNMGMSKPNVILREVVEIRDLIYQIRPVSPLIKRIQRIGMFNRILQSVVKKSNEQINIDIKDKLISIFLKDVVDLSLLINRDLVNEWNFHSKLE